MADHDFQCGDMVRCVNKYYAEQLRITGKSGIVMGTKPHHVHVWFEEQNRGYWITHDLLRRAADQESLSPLNHRIRKICYLLKAEEWELEVDPEIYRLICYVDEVPFETMVELKAFLDAGYRSLVFKPEGMGRMIGQVEWLK